MRTISPGSRQTTRTRRADCRRNALPAPRVTHAGASDSVRATVFARFRRERCFVSDRFMRARVRSALVAHVRGVAQRFCRRSAERRPIGRSTASRTRPSTRKRRIAARTRSSRQPLDQCRGLRRSRRLQARRRRAAACTVRFRRWRLEPRRARLAHEAASLGYWVAGFSTPQFLKALDAGESECSDADGLLAKLGSDLVGQLDLPRDTRPVVIGYSSGATIVYAALAADDGRRARRRRQSRLLSGSFDPQALLRRTRWAHAAQTATAAVRLRVRQARNGEGAVAHPAGRSRYGLRSGSRRNSLAGKPIRRP